MSQSFSLAEALHWERVVACLEGGLGNSERLAITADPLTKSVARKLKAMVARGRERLQAGEARLAGKRPRVTQAQAERSRVVAAYMGHGEPIEAKGP